MPNWKAFLCALVVTIGVILVGTSIRGPSAEVLARAGLTRNLSNAKQLAIAINLLAKDHDGHFPLHLSQIVPEYLRAEDWHSLLFASETARGRSAQSEYDWLYFGAFFDEKHPPPLLIVSPHAFRDGKKQKRIVIRGDFTGQIINDDEYQVELRKTIEAMHKRAGTPASKPDAAPEIESAIKQ